MIFPEMRSPRVVKPLIGISCCTKQFGIFGMPNHAASDTYVRATDEVIGAVPVLLPANGPTADIETLLDRLDGIILTGSRSNVQPELYDGPPHAEGTPEDPNRDGITLPLIRAAVARGVPLLAICRGFQELNVALGGSLHQRMQDLPDRMDHSTPMQPSARVRQGKAHAIQRHPGRLAAPPRRRAGDRGELAAQPGDQPARARPGRRGDRAGRHDRGGARHRQSRPAPRSAMPSGCSGIRNTTGAPTRCRGRSSSNSAPRSAPMPTRRGWAACPSRPIRATTGPSRSASRIETEPCRQSAIETANEPK